MALNQRWYCPLGDMWQCLERFLIVTITGRWISPLIYGYREDSVVAKHSAVYGKTAPSTKICQSNMFLVLEVGTTGLERKGQKRGWSEKGEIDCSDAYCLYCLEEKYSLVQWPCSYPACSEISLWKCFLGVFSDIWKCYQIRIV